MAVYTEVSFEELKNILAAYDLGEPHVFKGIAEGVSNSNYYLQTVKGSYILTLYEMRVSVADLPFYLGLMEHLASAGIRCPVPVHMRQGEVSGILNGRAAAILTFLNGVSLRRPAAEHCRLAGSALAELHAAGTGFDGYRPNTLGPSGWHRLAADCAHHADSITGGLRDLIDEELSFLDATWPAALPQGIIHADLFPDNVLFVDDKLSGLIDFYFACNDSFAFDLAITMNAWCFEADGSFNVTKSRALIGGYRERRPLHAEECEALPIFCRGAALRFLLTRLYDWINHSPAALVRPKDPREFLHRLRFHRAVTTPGAYGL